MKLNLGCGKDIRKGYINIDIYQHPGVKLDYICDVSKKIPLKNKSIEYVYIAHNLEHYNWLDAENVLREVKRVLKPKGKVRILVPDYEKIFRKYIRGDNKFFKPFIKYLNINYKYYDYMYHGASKNYLKKIKNNLPPKWHYSKKKKDKYNVKLRARYYSNLTEVIDWFVHQYGEHNSIHDEKSLRLLSKKIGFRNFIKTSYLNQIDENDFLRKKISLCVEMIK